MTAREKSKELIEKYYDCSKRIYYEDAIECAKIAVDEIIANTDMYIGNLNPKWSFWQEVKQELEKM